MLEVVINEENEGIRADKFLIRYLKCENRNFIYKMIRKKNIVLNEKKLIFNKLLKKGDVLKIYLSDDTLESIKTVSSSQVISNAYIDDIDVVYEDSNILIVNKPSGMLTQKAYQNDISLNDIVRKYLCKKNKTDDIFNIGPANRLDRNTQGLVCFGKNYISQRFLCDLFKQRKISKYYYAVCVGTITKERYLEDKIVKDCKNNKVVITDESNTPIKTFIKPINTNNELTLLDVHLITGKTHQIRVHLSSIAHPILGDYKYGIKKINDKYKEMYNIDSQLLVAYKLIFDDNIDGKFSYLRNKKVICNVNNKFNIVKEMINSNNLGNIEKEGIRGYINDIF